MIKYTTQFALILTFIGISFWVTAQDFQGKAIYKSQANMKVVLDSTSSSEEQAMIQKMIEVQMNNDYELIFDKNQSYFKKLEKLDTPNQANGVQVIMMSSGGEALYKNITEKRYSSEEDLFGKPFLVKDVLEDYEWELLGESKKIGQYTCYKAIHRDTVSELTIDEKGNRVEGKPKEVITTVWYAPDIPVSNGPEHFWGLPGLIMEVNEGDRVLICVKVILNPSNPVEITEPTKGKVVTMNEYNELLDAKLMEMQQMSQGGKQKNGSNMMKISIER